MAAFHQSAILLVVSGGGAAFLMVIGSVTAAWAQSGSGGPCTLDTRIVAGVARPVATIHTIVLHHTGIDSVGGSIATLRRRGLSYHYLIDVEGRMIRVVPSSRIALHAAGANRRSVGISLGGGATPDWTPSDAQWSAAQRLVGALARSHRRIQYLIGHGDVRDTNKGEPYGLSLERFLKELSAKESVVLRRPTADEEPLRGFRETALRLLERPLTPKHRTPAAQVPVVETVTCGGGRKVSYSVPEAFRGTDAVPR